MTISISPSPAPWAVSLDEVAAFLAANGRLPSPRTTDQAEKTLGRWLTSQHRRSDGAKGHAPHSPEETGALDERVPGWRGRINAAAIPWEKRLQELKAYRDAYGKWPSPRSTDPKVLSLARWLGTQRHDRRGNSAERRKILDEQLPGWNETPDQAWFRIANDVAAYRERVGEWPPYGSREETVRRLAKWLSDQRAGRNVSPEREAYLDDHLPGWRTGVGQGTRPLELWEDHVGRVERFHAANGRFPRLSRRWEENRLGVWLHEQRTDADMSAARRRVLDTRLPGWEATDRVSIQEWRASQEASWRSKLDDVVAYVARNGKAPSRNDYPALYDWLLRLRSHKVSPERRALLDERLPGWQGYPTSIRRPVRAA